MEDTNMIKRAIQVIYAQITGMATLPDWETCEEAYREAKYPKFNKEVDYIIAK